MRTATRITTIVLAATALSGCQSISKFFAFNQKPAEQPAATAASVFGAEELERGRAALKAGYPARAIEQFRLAALNEEVAADAFNGLGVAYAKLGRADLAERYFKTAMTIDSSNPRYAANLSRFYDSPLGQSQRALAMREAEEKAMLAQAEKAAVSQGLLQDPAPVKRIGAVTIDAPKPVAVSRAANREIKLVTTTDAANASSNLAAVSSRKASTPIADAVEQATADAVSKKRRPTVVSMLGLGRESAEGRARISVSKPGSLGATRPRARGYPVRIKLEAQPNK